MLLRRRTCADHFVKRSADAGRVTGARWEEAWSRLLLAEVLLGADRRRAERDLETALAVFQQLRSVQEAGRALALLEDVATSF